MQQHIDFPMGDFSDKISSLANLMKNPLSKVALLNDQNTFLVVTCLRLPFRSVGSGWQWISQLRPKLCEISVQIIGPLSHLHDFHAFPCDNIHKPFTLCITQSLNIQIHFHLLYWLASFCI